MGDKTRLNRARRDASANKVIVPAACDDKAAHVKWCREHVEKRCKEQAGDRALTSVTLVEFRGGEDCRSALMNVYAGDDRPETLAGLARYLRFFIEQPDNCVLVVGSIGVRTKDTPPTPPPPEGPQPGFIRRLRKGSK
jgi:hypothetical protein